MTRASGGSFTSSAPFTLSLLAVVILVTALVRLPLKNIPFERDEGEYAYIAWRMNHGEVPYRDWVDQKPPAIFWVYQTAFTLPLAPITAVHLVALLWSAASACALFFLARHFLDASPAALAALLFAILLADPMINGPSANTELFMLLPLILSQIVFLRAVQAARGKGWWAGLCGILIGAAIAFKQVAGVNWVLLIALYPMFARKPERTMRATLTFAGASACGIAVVWLIIASWFYFHRGFDEFVYQVLTHNLQYVRSLSFTERWRNFTAILGRLSAGQLLVLAMASLSLAGRQILGGWKGLAFVFGWLMTSFAGVSASGQFFPHYFQQLVPALCLAAAIGAEWLIQARPFAQRPRGVLRVALTALLLLLPAQALYPYSVRNSLAATLHEIYPLSYFEVAPALGERLAQLTRPDDKVYVFGAEPEVLFYARRVSATRYIFLFPLYGPYPDALANQRRVTEEVSRARPEVVLYSPQSAFFTPGVEPYLTDWTHDYLGDYRADAFVCRDPRGITSVVAANNGLLPDEASGQEVTAILLLRNPH